MRVAIEQDIKVKSLINEETANRSELLESLENTQRGINSIIPDIQAIFGPVTAEGMGDIKVGEKEQEDKVAEGAYIKVLLFKPFIFAAVKEIREGVVLATF